MNKQFLVINAESGDYESNFFTFLTDHELYTMADKYLVYDVINHKKLKYVSHTSFYDAGDKKEYDIVWEDV